MKIRRTIACTTWVVAFALALVAASVLGALPAYAQTNENELEPDEVSGLLFMLEEEKLARDVYLTLGEQWGLPVFQNISRAEQTHMDAVASLLEQYEGEAAPADGELGTFEDQDLQALYDQLTSSGSRSVADALLVGVVIEEIDILDLQEQLRETENADIQRVYANLLRGSGNHLRAFVTNVERRTGETVQPQYLEQDQFDEIMAGSSGHNGNGRGVDRGNGAGRGGHGRQGPEGDQESRQGRRGRA